MPVDPQLQSVLELVNASTPMHEQSPAEARESFRALTVGFRKPEDVVAVAAVSDETVPGAQRPLPARVYRPEAEGAVPTVVLLHGGGFVIGDLDTHDNLARTLCRDTGSVVVSVDYRLAPESPYPAAADDAIAAVAAVAENLQRYGGSDRLGVAGDSAGGNLAAVAAQAQPERITAQLLAYPATDFSGDYASRETNGEGYFLEAATMAYFAGHYAPDPTTHTEPRLSPMRAESLAGLPPAVVVTAEFDPLRDEGEAYAAALHEAGVPVSARRFDAMIHGFVDMGMFSAAAKAATEETVALFSELLHR